MIKSKIEVELEKDKLHLVGIKNGFIVLTYNSNKLPLILYVGTAGPAEKSIHFLGSYIQIADSIILKTTEDKILFREKDYTYHCNLICNLPNERYIFPSNWECLADKRNPAEQLEIALELLK